MTILTLICLLATDPQLRLTVDSTEIGQCDHVVVKCVIANVTDQGVYIEQKVPGPAIQFERRTGDSWTAFRGMDLRNTRQTGGGLREPPLLEAAAAYAEYNGLLLDEKDRFLFADPKVVAIRAVAQVSGKRLVSAPVEITVTPRDPAHIKRIREAGISVASLGNYSFEGTIPEKVATLEGVGGNIDVGIKNFQLMERIIFGDERTGEDVVKYIRDRTDPVYGDLCLLILGHHYLHHKRDWPNLAEVVDALPENSWKKRSFQASLDFHLREVPKVIVPDKAPNR